MYKPYADKEYYKTVYKGTSVSDDVLDKMLIKISRHIDALTHNRIVSRGFDNLTEFQKELIKEIVCEQADFEVENSELIENVLTEYTINGVSMKFGSSWNVILSHGIAIKKETYSLLEQTGLTCRILR